jgi:hypothetical protein
MILDKETDEVQELPPITFKQILTDIWSSPRRTHELIHYNEYGKHLYLILALAGIYNYGGNIGYNSLISLFILGTLSGVITAFIYSMLVSFLGSFFGGKADFFDILRAYAYSAIPTLIALIIFVLSIVAFSNATTTMTEGILSVIYILDLICLFLFIWGFVIFVVGVSVVEQFSIGKAIFTSVFPLVVIFGILFLVVYFQ